MKTKLLFIVLGVIIILGLGARVLKMQNDGEVNDGKNYIVCTQEARLCPDGSAVGRTGPNCEFEPCPTGNTGRIAGGYVSGYVNIGPFCPVEREGVPCAVPPEAYTSREVVVYQSDRFTEKERVNLDKDGNYKITLGPGNYFAQIEPAGIGPGEKKPFTVISFQTTTVDFDIDTGIR